MGRIRTIKPELALHEGMYDAEIETGLPLRFAWAMLFTACDKEGRFEWRPRALKAMVLPYDEVDFSRVLHAWLTRGFIVKYACQGRVYGAIPSWRKHQVINNREKDSEIPSPDEESAKIQEVTDACPTRAARVAHATLQEGEGERKGKGIKTANAVSSTPSVAVPVDDILDMYHRKLPELPKVVVVNDARRKAIRRRWLDEFPTLAHWEHYFDAVREQPFLLGEGNDRDWAATFDWLLKPANLAKVVERTYEGRRNAH